MTTISLREVSLHRAERVVLRSINADLQRSLTLVTGETGSGKSTLIHLLAAILRPTSGEVIVDGQAVSRFTAAHRDRWRRTVGLVLQTSHFLRGLTVAENVMVPLLPRGEPITRMRERVGEALSQVGLSDRAGQDPRSLSVGQRGRVSLARALVAAPEIVLADEPTAHQDDPSVSMVIEQLKGARDRGAVVVVASHDPRLRESDLFDRRLRIEQHTLVEDP